ncbi:chromate transporter [Halobacillus sp. B23F22_1]|uniref:chromate transporter n=1 Tax=Halobacillus sp. B23F22_1 TaxID=3459514 RepID=UPI00373E7D5A
MLLLHLFIEFFIIGLFGFGGGYAMIPLMEQAVYKHRWLSQEQFTDIIAIAGSAPGPIATNSALVIGYQTSGIKGAIVAAGGNLLPALLLILLLIKFLSHHSQTHWLSRSLKGIHPVITALILYAGIRMGLQNGIFSTTADFTQYMIMGLAMILLYKKVSPAWVIGLSGVLGVLIYGF